VNRHDRRSASTQYRHEIKRQDRLERERAERAAKATKAGAR
jgi:hypothetical protein